MLKPTENVLKYAPWSISKAEIIKQCPKRFDYQYVNRPSDEKPAPNTDALVGRAVHSAVEYAMGGVDVAKGFHSACIEHKLTTVEKEIVMGFLPNVQQFLSRFAAYKRKHDCAAPLLENKLGVTIEGKPTHFFAKDIFLRGVVDVGMLFNKAPDALILDHKTGKRRDISHFDAQFDAYMLLLRAKFEQLEGVYVGLNFLRDNAIDLKKGKQSVADIEPILDRVMLFLNNATQDVGDLQTVRPTPLCGWCDFREICPAHADGTNGKNKRNP